MKNPDNKPLQIVGDTKKACNRAYDDSYPIVLSNLAIAESNLVKAGKDSAMPHFIAIVKEIERYYGIAFKQIDDSTTQP